MSATIKKPTITTASGHTLTIAPETENPPTIDEWFKDLEDWRKNNMELAARISVEEFLTEKRATNEKGLS